MARRTIDQLYALTVPEIQEIFLQVMQGIVDKAMIEEMVAAIEANDVDRLFKATGFTPAALGPILDRIEQAYYDAAESSVDGWPKRIKTPFGLVRPSFDARNPRVEEDLRNYSSQWITRITDEARDNVRSVLEQGMINGDNPRRVALDIVGRVNPTTGKREGGIIGLAANEERWVNSTRRYLQQLDEKYFTLNLRDKRFDSTVRKAIDENKPLSQDTVSKLLTSYKNRALKYRAEAVSRTEAIQALNRGEKASIDQAISDGYLSTKQVKKWWDDVRDARTREGHKAAGKKYSRENAIDLEEAFVLVDGERLLFPGDSSLGATAKNIVHCRCQARYTVNWREDSGNGE